LAEQEKELPADHPYRFFPLVLVRQVTETDNLHTQVTQHKYTSNTTHKQSKQTENDQNCKTLGLFILLSAKIWSRSGKMTENASNSFSRKKKEKLGGVHVATLDGNN